MKILNVASKQCPTKRLEAKQLTEFFYMSYYYWRHLWRHSYGSYVAGYLTPVTHDTSKFTATRPQIAPRDSCASSWQ